MSRPIVFSLCMFITTAAIADQLPDVDTIIARHIEARGGEEALRNIHSLVFDRGTYKEPGFTIENEAVMMIMRPYHKLVGHPERDPGFMEGYDGAAWEWFADPGIVVRTVGPASEAIRHGADVEGAFLDYAGKGYQMKLIGEAMIGDRPTYQVRATAMDGTRGDSFIDQETYLLIASRFAAPVHAFGEDVTRENRFGDFREVSGVLFPFRDQSVVIATGEILSSMQCGSIKANVDIPPSWFSPPRFERTAIQTLIEQLYIQRADPDAVMWTYHQFRRSNPGVSTQMASEVAGYQSLKMGAVDAAIALLERNARDYPDAANSAFGLGRAYRTAGRLGDARIQFQRALRLNPEHARSRQALADIDQ